MELSKANRWRIEVCIGDQRAVLVSSDGERELVAEETEMAACLLDAVQEYVKAARFLFTLSTDPGLDRLVPGRMPEKTYITEVKHEGPKIEASSWEEAQRLAQEQGVILAGELAS